VAAEFFERFSKKDITGTLNTMSDDATWWIAGKPGTTPTAGVQE
jgi:ketosteroid isomerase-like protein